MYLTKQVSLKLYIHFKCQIQNYLNNFTCYVQETKFENLWNIWKDEQSLASIRAIDNKVNVDDTIKY